ASLPPTVARTRKHLRKLLFQQRLNEVAHSAAHAVLDGVNPVVEKQAFVSPRSMLRDIFVHGVVSSPARQRRNQLGLQTRRLRQPISTTSRTAPRHRRAGFPWARRETSRRAGHRGTG